MSRNGIIGSVLEQVAIRPELKPPVAKEVLITELGAVATRSKHSTVSYGLSVGDIVDCKVEFMIRSLRLPVL